MTDTKIARCRFWHDPLGQCDCEIELKDNGDWVDFEDHESAIRKAVEEERERCARIAENHWEDESYPGNGACACQSEIAEKIRRGG